MKNVWSQHCHTYRQHLSAAWGLNPKFLGVWRLQTSVCCWWISWCLGSKECWNRRIFFNPAPRWLGNIQYVWGVVIHGGLPGGAGGWGQTGLPPFQFFGGITTTVKLAIKLTMKLKTSPGPARLAQLLQPSLAFCCTLQPMTCNNCASLAELFYCSCFL